MAFTAETLVGSDSPAHPTVVAPIAFFGHFNHQLRSIKERLNTDPVRPAWIQQKHNLFIEGLVKLSLLTDDGYYYEKDYVIKGRRHGRKFRLGDNVQVKVKRINAFRSEIEFDLV